MGPFTRQDSWSTKEGTCVSIFAIQHNGPETLHQSRTGKHHFWYFPALRNFLSCDNDSCKEMLRVYCLWYIRQSFFFFFFFQSFSSLLTLSRLFIFFFLSAILFFFFYCSKLFMLVYGGIWFVTELPSKI